MKQAIDTFVSVVQERLQQPVSAYLYGSAVLEDFQFGWSDIDILCLTALPIANGEALVNLRQDLQKTDPENDYYDLFEGVVAWKDAFLRGPCRAVYWGTSGQRMTDNYELDCFSRKILMEKGVLLCGEDVRSQMNLPTYAELYNGILHHCRTIRQYGSATTGLYRFGWMLDIARCLYTLRTGEIIAKTAAGKWAMEENLCPVPDALMLALLVRQTPLTDWYGMDIRDEDIQAFADVLEQELERKA